MYAGKPLSGLVRRFLTNRAGQFALMTAVMMPVALVLAAIAVDSGSIYVEKRRAQALADLVAITAAANLHNPIGAAHAVLADNGISGVAVHLGPEPAQVPADQDRLTVLPGQYTGSIAVDVAQRFAPASGTSRNAVKVTYRTTGTRHFAATLIPPPRIGVTSIAHTRTGASFSIGSRLLNFEDGIVNKLLGQVLGTNIALTLMDYEALLDTKVSLLTFLDALAVRTNLTAGTYQQVLDADVTMGQVAQAMADTQRPGSGAHVAASRLVGQIGTVSSAPIRLSRLFDLGDIRNQLVQAAVDHVALDVGLLDLLSASALAAGKGKQVALDLGATVPELLKTVVTLAIGEPPQAAPWLRVGTGGEVVRTAQTRLAVVVEIAMPESLKTLLGARIRLPLYLEVAFAEARIKSVSCPTGQPESRRVEVETRPGVIDLYVADVDTSKLGGFANPRVGNRATLIQVPLIKISGKAHAELGETTYKTLIFTDADIRANAVKTVSTQAITTSLVQSLLSGLELSVDISVGGLLNLPLVTLPPGTLALLGTTIGNATKAIDDLLASLLSTLGLALGQADVRVYGGSCGRAVLVQ